MPVIRSFGVRDVVLVNQASRAYVSQRASRSMCAWYHITPPDGYLSFPFADLLPPFTPTKAPAFGVEVGPRKTFCRVPPLKGRVLPILPRATKQSYLEGAGGTYIHTWTTGPHENQAQAGSPSNGNSTVETPTYRGERVKT